MEKNPTLFVESMCKHLAECERETIAKLGEEKASFFVRVWEDSMTIGDPIIKADSQRPTLMSGTFLGLPYEISWLQFLFACGNYSLMFSRLRHVWESVARAYFMENYSEFGDAKWPAPGPSPDDKLAWLGEFEKHLKWRSCIEPVIRKVFPNPTSATKKLLGYSKLDGTICIGTRIPRRT